MPNITLPDDAQVAVDELNRNVPLLEIVHQDPYRHYNKVDQTGQMPDRAIYDQVDMVVFNGLRLNEQLIYALSECSKEETSVMSVIEAHIHAYISG